MWFPFQKTSRKATVDGAIERYRRARQTRPMLGLHVDSRFSEVNGAAVEIRGSGKWMRIRVLGNLRVPLTGSLAEGCRCAVDGQSTASETVGIGYDLGEFCADVVDQLLARASLSVEDTLAVCVDEPGLRWLDYDGRLECSPLFQPQRFTERTGLCVIDALSAADVAAGGRGGPLDALPMWLLFADRRPPLARSWRWLVQLEDIAAVTLFPPSDGLDAELPEIRRWVLPGVGIFDALDERRAADPKSPFDQVAASPDLSSDRVAALAVQGRSHAKLVERLTWNDAESCRDLLEMPEPKTPSGEPKNSPLRSWMKQVAAEVDQEARTNGLPWSDVYCSATAALVDQLSAVVSRHEHECAEVILAGRGRHNGLIVSGLRKGCHVDEVAVLDDCGFHSDALPAVVAAVLGMMHVDQMPASLPWLTGCLVPRLHGRVTPGRPVYWRRLVTEMADFHPPAMKLRDAV